mgnify:CR=1 FL=1
MSFGLVLNNPSKIAELQELEHWKQKFEIAASATEGYFSRRWIMEHIFAMSHEEFTRNQREMYYDRKHDAALQAVAEAAAAETAAPGGLGGDLAGGDLGAGLGGDLGDDLGGDLGGPAEMPAGEAEAPAGDEGDDSALLAVPPGSRNSPKVHKGPNSHSGKVYYPKRDDKRTGSGPRTRSLAGHRNAEKSSNTKRNVFPGSEINSLAKPVGISVGIYEEEQSSYSLRETKEEDKLFEINDSIRVLLEGLEIKENTPPEQKNESKA